MTFHRHVVSKTLLVTAFFGLALISFAYRPNNATLALVTKTVQDVTKKSVATEWGKVVHGDILTAGDQVRTGVQSLAIIKFMDKSVVRVREQSELMVTADGQRGALVKIIQLNGGAFGFDIKKQENERFRFTSPTSVASIRGTKGKLSDAQGNDTLTMTDGLTNFKNNVSNTEIEVAAGYIAFSSPDGSITSRKATPQELADASNAVGGASNELKLELQDSKGNKKELKLRYKQ